VDGVIADVVKAIGAVFSAAFGIYGIGAKTRNDDSSLTRAGWVATLGIILSLIVTLVAQILDGRAGAKKSEAETQRFENLTSDVFYQPFSSDEAKIDMSFFLTLDQLRTVDAHYTARLEGAFHDRSQCGERSTKIGLIQHIDYNCNGYTITSDELEGDELTFDSKSPLAPNEQEVPALRLLNSIGLAFVIHPKNETDIQRLTAPLPLALTFKRFWPDTKFKLDKFGLTIEIHQEPLSPGLLEDENVSSLIDLLGARVDLDPHLRFFRGDCVAPGSRPSYCESMSKILYGGSTLVKFVLRFPHRRQLAYNDFSWSGGVDCSKAMIKDPFKENSEMKSYIVYECSVPNQVDQITPAKRR
jgi:hypothetical protein